MQDVGVDAGLARELGRRSRPDKGYERTRRFYEARGFVALEEIHGLWDGNPCLLMVKRL